MRWMLGSALAVGLVLSTGGQASAASPDVLEEYTRDDTFVVAAGVYCHFDVQVRETASVIWKVFYDGAGHPARLTRHMRGTTYYSLPGGDVVATSRVSDYLVSQLDPETDTLVSESLIGNHWNVHGGAGGVLVNDSGRLVVVFDTDEIISNGPEEAFRGELDALCTLLASTVGG